MGFSQLMTTTPSVPKANVESENFTSCTNCPRSDRRGVGIFRPASGRANTFHTSSQTTLTAPKEAIA